MMLRINSRIKIKRELNYANFPRITIKRKRRNFWFTPWIGFGKNWKEFTRAENIFAFQINGATLINTKILPFAMYSKFVCFVSVHCLPVLGFRNVIQFRCCFTFRIFRLSGRQLFPFQEGSCFICLAAVYSYSWQYIFQYHIYRLIVKILWILFF